MSKLVIRLTILIVALYMGLCHILGVTLGVNIWSHTYTVLFEICVCLCITAQGVYHCKYMRWTAYGICLSDLWVSLDELLDFSPYSISIILPISLVGIGLFTTVTLAIIHYIKVRKLKRRERLIKEAISKTHPQHPGSLHRDDRQ